MIRKIALTGTVITFLAACEPSEIYPVPIGAGGGGNGGSYSAPVQQPAPAQSLAPLPMLQDPEGKLEDESITIYADSLDIALKQCTQTAQNRSDQHTIVSCIGCRLMTGPKTGQGKRMKKGRRLRAV